MEALKQAINILEKETYEYSVPTGTIVPTLFDKKTNRLRNVLSVKHAAVLAGLGYIGKNSLLITQEYGNIVWLSAVLTDIELELDEIKNGKCPENCNICVKNCPASAIKANSLEIDQKACFEYAYYVDDG